MFVYHQLQIFTAERSDEGAREHSNPSPITFRQHANRFACIYPLGTNVLHAEKDVPGAIYTVGGTSSKIKNKTDVPGISLRFYAHFGKIWRRGDIFEDIAVYLRTSDPFVFGIERENDTLPESHPLILWTRCLCEENSITWVVTARCDDLADPVLVILVEKVDT